MDDHVYEQVMSYAECELLPRFREECKHSRKITECASYEEVKDLCTALNAIAKWAGYDRVTPSSFLRVY